MPLGLGLAPVSASDIFGRTSDLIAAGQAFRTTTGELASAGDGVLGIQGVTNNLNVNVFIYSLLMVANTSQSDNRLYINPNSILVDAGLTVNLLTSIVNQNPGSSVVSQLTALNGSPAAPVAANPSNAGTQVGTYGILGNTTQQFLQNGSGLWLPKGKQNTFAAYGILAAAAKGAITIEWVEFP